MCKKLIVFIAMAGLLCCFVSKNAVAQFKWDPGEKAPFMSSFGTISFNPVSTKTFGAVPAKVAPISTFSATPAKTSFGIAPARTVPVSIFGITPANKTSFFGIAPVKTDPDPVLSIFGTTPTRTFGTTPIKVLGVVSTAPAIPITESGSPAVPTAPAFAPTKTPSIFGPKIGTVSMDPTPSPAPIRTFDISPATAPAKVFDIAPTKTLSVFGPSVVSMDPTPSPAPTAPTKTLSVFGPAKILGVPVSTFGASTRTLGTFGLTTVRDSSLVASPIFGVSKSPVVFGKLEPAVTLQVVRQEPKGISLKEVPKLSVEIAQEFLNSLPEDMDGSTWKNAKLGVAYPVYNPAIKNGQSPAYFEFQVLRPSAGQDLALTRAPKYEDAGYIMVSATEDDSPVTGFSMEGPTQTRTLFKELADKDTISAKIFRYDDALIVAESKNEKLSQIGPDPVRFCCNADISDSLDQIFEAEVDELGVITEDISPEMRSEPYRNWQEFRNDYLENDFFIRFREENRRNVILEWDIVLERERPVLDISQGINTTILRGQKIQSFSLVDPSIAEIQVLDSGLTIVPQVDEGGSIISIVDSRGEKVDYLLGVTDPKAIEPRFLGSWGSWHYYLAGNWNDQRRYRQEPCCGCFTGCGPVAWAMLYGWWDKKGWSNLIDGTAPLYLNSNVRTCILSVRNYTSTFCISGQGATWPSKMHRGYKWARDRYNAGDINGYSVSSRWTFPCFYSSTCRNKASGCIKNNHRPAIIGIGCTSAHYPLAYGYAWRKKKWLGITIKTSRWFKVNMGHQNPSGVWKKARVWFGQKALFN